MAAPLRFADFQQIAAAEAPRLAVAGLQRAFGDDYQPLAWGGMVVEVVIPRRPAEADRGRGPSVRNLEQPRRRVISDGLFDEPRPPAPSGSIAVRTTVSRCGSCEGMRYSYPSTMA